MRITVLTGIICAAIWIMIKMIFYYTQPVNYDLKPLVLINLFLLIASISIGLYLQKRKDTEESNGLRDIKNGMTAGVPYAVLVSVFLYFYYDRIHPEYNAHRLAEQEYALDLKLNDPASFEQIKQDNPDFEVMSKEEIKDQVMTGVKSTLSANATLVTSLLGLIIMTALNSIFITIIYRRIVFRETRRKPE
jgi:hypothetical protein